ncbi:MAG TPA: hypothetical protein VGX28_12765 [Frankiaceae bacterium]|jgi:hypothetical protein|nr:hypothetical protein [Frankiaceae bacterium]
MRRTLASFFVLVSTAGLLVGLGGTASAAEAPVSSNGCVAYSDVPHLDVVKQSSRIVSTGTLSCLAESTGMTIEVCVEEQYAVDAPWWKRGCVKVTDLNEYRDTIEATVSVSVPVYATWLRTTVRGWNAAGKSATFATPPTFWFNCACYIG